MIVFFLRTLPIIASIILYPAYSLCKEPSVAPHSEAKLVNGKAKNTLNHTWVNREVGVLEEHEPILVPEDIPFMDENDQPHIFDEFYGQVLLVNFWATWCAPCTQEMPALSKLQRDFKRKNFKVLAISGDFKGVDAIREFYAAHEITNLPIYHDPKNVLSKTFGINSFKFVKFIKCADLLLLSQEETGRSYRHKIPYIINKIYSIYNYRRLNLLNYSIRLCRKQKPPSL
jgi:thiol-disulfide isomerase/thioredoxin